MYIKRTSIKNFRTLGTEERKTFDVEFDASYQIIAGANNSGKSNLLRALNIFFNEGWDDISDYEKEKDLSFHIAHGTGSYTPTYIEVDLYLEDNEINKIKDLYKYGINQNIIRTRTYYGNELDGWFYSNSDGNYPTQKELKEGKNKIDKKTHPIDKLFKRIQFIYIPAQYDISSKINQLVAEEILPTMVDTYGNRGLSSQVKKLKEKIDEVDKLTSEILQEKNSLITESFRDVIKEFPEIQAGIDIENYELEVAITGDNLSEILSKRIELNVKDASHNDVDSKGSGIQKLVLVTLLEYFSKNNEEKARYTNPFIIWGIDEPETYMQPKLQKKVGEIFKNVSKTHQIIITTHSPKMIDIYNPHNVKLFYLDNEKFYVTRKKKYMFKKITKMYESKEFGFIDKLKEHFGVETNDGWLLRDRNILFEGSDDIVYFHSTFFRMMGYKLDVANISSDSSENMPNFIELLYQQITNKELNTNSIICLLDNDNAGQKAYSKITAFQKREKNSKKYVKVYKTISLYLTNKDNQNTNYPSMIEDMVIPEVFYKSVCDFMTNKYGEVDLSQYSFEAYQIFRKQSKRTPIMEVIDNYFSDVISETENFSFTNLSVKYALSNTYQSNMTKLNTKDIEKYQKKYSKLISFFEEFTK